MIQLCCASCKAELLIDEGFAGGVCRCQHCGAIQTVPSHLKRRAATPEAALAGTGSQAAPAHVEDGRTLYQTATRPGSGLDELANVVASSGLGSARLQPAQKPTVATPNRKTFIIAGAVAGGIIVAALVIWLIVKSGPTPGGPTSSGGTSEQRSGGGPSAAEDTKPGYLGLEVKGPAVVYLLDRGQTSSSIFESLKLATFKSLDSLGSGMKFQVAFWDIDSAQPAAWPESGMTAATKENVAAAHHGVDDVYAYGRTSLAGALKRAIAQHPVEIMIATGKSELDESDIKACQALLGKSPPRINTFAVGSSGVTQLKALSQKTGGAYREVSEAEIK